MKKVRELNKIARGLAQTALVQKSEMLQTSDDLSEKELAYVAAKLIEWSRVYEQPD